MLFQHIHSRPVVADFLNDVGKNIQEPGWWFWITGLWLSDERRCWNANVTGKLIDSHVCTGGEVYALIGKKGERVVATAITLLRREAWSHCKNG